jgi:3' terminal RNA ribose 2'-O-methyltransferase Hen1
VLLTITTTHRPATELGFLLHKHPERVQSFSTSFGRATVFYPEASEERCTAALLLTIDPVGLVRRDQGPGTFALAQYVNDRPYVASSFLSVAMTTVFSTAMAGVCKGHQELADSPIPLEATLPVVPAGGGDQVVRQLFEPLGYEVRTTAIPLDASFPEWGNSRYLELRLRRECRLAELLNHLYVLLPVLDDDKHYWVDQSEIEKLMRRGDGWLGAHPERDLIVKRYLKRQAQLYFPALAALDDAEPRPQDDSEQSGGAVEAELEQPLSLRDQRLDAVRSALRSSGARRVLDLGCGPGALLRLLLEDDYDHVLGADVSMRALEKASRRLKLDEMHDAQRGRVSLIQSPLTYRDRRLEGFDAAALVEVIEHLDAARLAALERNVFGSAQPGTVVVTTPNAEYNVKWQTLPAGEFRHADHRFEWSRAEFSEWASGVAERYGYVVDLTPVGPEDPAVGSPTQMAVFSR